MVGKEKPELIPNTFEVPERKGSKTTTVGIFCSGAGGQNT